MSNRLVLVSVLAALLVSVTGYGQEENKPDKKASENAKHVTFHSEKIKAPDKISLKSEAFGDGEKIPEKYSAYGQGVSPALSWSGVPEGTQSLVVMMEDPDAADPKPFVHWLLYDLPADTKSLPENLPKKGELEKPAGARQGQTSAKLVGYFGPKPPPWKPHHYHFQVFALDKKLDLKPEAKREDLLEAMSGHVLAKGLLVGTYQKDKKEDRE